MPAKNFEDYEQVKTEMGPIHSIRGHEGPNIRRNSVVLDKTYRDKSWHTPNKFSLTFFSIIVQNIALEVELETLDSINTSKLKNTRGRLALLT